MAAKQVGDEPLLDVTRQAAVSLKSMRGQPGQNKKNRSRCAPSVLPSWPIRRVSPPSVRWDNRAICA